MSGLEKGLARRPQLYRRVGFAQPLRTVSTDNCASSSPTIGSASAAIRADDFTDGDAVAAVARITNGDFRLVHRPSPKITRILDVDQLTTVTSEVAQAARDIRDREPHAAKIAAMSSPDRCDRDCTGWLTAAAAAAWRSSDFTNPRCHRKPGAWR